MNSKAIRNTAIAVLCVLLIAFGIYNAVWYLGAYKPYKAYQSGFPEIEQSKVRVYTDEDDFQYSVTVPKYLSWNGNLAVSEKNVDYALIIWLKPFGNGSEQGVILKSADGTANEIMLKNKTTAADGSQQKDVDENQKIISLLCEKAETVWDCSRRKAG